MVSSFSTASSTSSDEVHAYHPSLLSLFTFFAATLCDVYFFFVTDPDEIAYIVAARWPGFIQPVLDAYEANRSEDPDVELDTTALESRARLMTHFKSTFKSAMEDLYPRLTNAAAWAKAHAPQLSITEEAPLSPRKTGRALPNGDIDTLDKDESCAVRGLPAMSRFLLIAAYVASTNPPKSDLRMFARETERGKKRKGGGARKNPARSKQSKVRIARHACFRPSMLILTLPCGQVPQRLAGPTPFPLDRLMAILGYLLDSYDLDARNPGPEFSVPGSYTELELGRVHVYAAVRAGLVLPRTLVRELIYPTLQITELSTMHLLQRTSPLDRIDGPPTFRCGISQELALTLARDLHVPLLELLWETQN
jgi:origin recognition complex subunit 5